ncbi:hypothetical protein QTN25_001854 [Entamoeba marina]
METNESRVDHAATNRNPNDFYNLDLSCTSSPSYDHIIISMNEANSGFELSKVESVCMEEGTYQQEECIGKTILTNQDISQIGDGDTIQNDSSQTQLDINFLTNTIVEKADETIIQPINTKENGENNTVDSETELEQDYVNTNNTTTKSTLYDPTDSSKFEYSQSQQVDQREVGVMSEENNEEDEESEEIGTSFMDDNEEDEEEVDEEVDENENVEGMSEGNNEDNEEDESEEPAEMPGIDNEEEEESEEISAKFMDDNDEGVDENEDVDGMSEENNEDNEEDESEGSAEMSEIDNEEDEEYNGECNEEVEETSTVVEKDKGVVKEGEEGKRCGTKSVAVKANEEDDKFKSNKPITYKVDKYIKSKEEMDKYYNEFEEICIDCLDKVIQSFLGSKVGSELRVNNYSSEHYFKNGFVIMNVLQHIHKKFIEQDISEGSKLAQLLVLDRIKNKVNTILYTQQIELGLLYTFLPRMMETNHYIFVFSIDVSFLKSQRKKMKANGLKASIQNINDFKGKIWSLNAPTRVRFINLRQLNNDKTEQFHMRNVKKMLRRLDGLKRIDLLIFDGVRDISDQNPIYPQQYFKVIEEIKQECKNATILFQTPTVFTQRSSKDIKDKIHVENCDEIINYTNFNPTHGLIYEVEIVKKGPILNRIPNKINSSPFKNKHGVIVCNGRKRCEELVRGIKIGKGVLASFYNPDLVNNEDNDRIFRKWKNGQIKVLVVEKASPKIRKEKGMAFVIHADLPCSLEQYVHDTSVLGNTFSKTKCILYYDVTKSNEDLENGKHISKMQQYVESKECCLNKKLKELCRLGLPMKTCGKCDHCIKKQQTEK